MIEGLIFLASYGFDGSRIGDLFARWQEMGIFSYLLPGLMIFALVFVILNAIKIFKENRAVNAILAAVVAIMALQFNFVPIFFSEIFPRLGVGLAIILVILIGLGLFIDPEKAGIMYTLLGIAGIIVIAVLLNTAGVLGWGSAYTWREYLPEIITGIVFVIVIAVIVGVSKPDSKPYKSLMLNPSS